MESFLWTTLSKALLNEHDQLVLAGPPSSNPMLWVIESESEYLTGATQK